jgi:hypothetical protein
LWNPPLVKGLKIYEQSANPHRPDYWPDPVFEVLAVAGTAFGTLK